MEKQDYIFLVLLLCLAIYNVVLRIRQVQQSKSRKLLRQKYPIGFIRDGKIYRFTTKHDQEISLPEMNSLDEALFKSCRIKSDGLVDCRYDFVGFFADGDGGGYV